MPQEPFSRDRWHRRPSHGRRPVSDRFRRRPFLRRPPGFRSSSVNRKSHFIEPTENARFRNPQQADLEDFGQPTFFRNEAPHSNPEAPELEQNSERLGRPNELDGEEVFTNTNEADLQPTQLDSVDSKAPQEDQTRFWARETESSELDKPDQEQQNLNDVASEPGSLDPSTISEPNLSEQSDEKSGETAPSANVDQDMNNSDELAAQTNGTPTQPLSEECVMLELEHGSVCVKKTLFGSLQ
ncbi:hypothetical protein K7432_002433 [Basidiobolus ranarum]|uniref:Uncharacterized protein n=1 Tax=Basidiobolus ranarum TaxID=34480 RepID=A0ABR2X1I6_9FUNG